jgi:hypothetical protein
MAVLLGLTVLQQYMTSFLENLPFFSVRSYGCSPNTCLNRSPFWSKGQDLSGRKDNPFLPERCYTEAEGQALHLEEVI